MNNAVSSLANRNSMKNMRVFGFILSMVCIFGACTQEHDHKGKKPLVEVAGQFLYEEDLRLAMPLNLSKDDSVLFAEHYIKTWVEDILLFDKAEGNIPNNDKIKALVENYRKALIMHVYQEELVNQRLAGSISDNDINNYYENNKALFVLEEPVVKGLLIKVPLQSQGLADVRRWYKQNSQAAIEKLEKYSLRHAVTYDYFYDQWKVVKDLSAIIPSKELKMNESYLDKNRNVELKDTAYHYFLHVEDYLGEGKVKPLDFAREEIKEILINLKRVNFIQQVKDELYKDASEDNRINYYYLDSNE